MRIDSHQHFWIYDPEECAWIDDSMQRIARDFLPPDLKPELDALELDGCVVVHAHQTIEHSRWLCELASQYDYVRGVVIWADLCSDSLDASLEELAAHPKVCGVRHLLQWEEDPQFAVRPDFVRGIERLADFGLAYDLCIFPTQLEACAQLAAKLPDQRFVLDHLGKPYIAKAECDPWREQIRELAKNDNVFCKVSGMVTEAKWNEWTVADFAPYLDTVLEAFGPERLMYGSDWPVCLVAARDYSHMTGIPRQWTDGWSEDQRSGFWGENCARFYGLS